MAYNPSIYSPYAAQQYQPTMPPANQQYMSAFQPQQPINGLIKVDGIEGARMYQLPPNSVSPPLFIGSENAFFIKTTDGGGAATLKKYTFDEAPMNDSVSGEFVTREYFDRQMNNILEAINGQHTVQGQPSATGQSDIQPDQQGQAIGSV